MDTHLTKTGKTVLPIVYPLILYTGKRSFNFSMDLFDLFGKHKALARTIYKSPYQLIDLTRASDEELVRYEWFRIAALLSKHVHDVDILPFLKGVMELLQKLENCGEFRYINLSIRYIMEAVSVSNKEEFFKTITQGLRGEYKMMTIAEQLKREGRKEGFKQGTEKGAEEKAVLIAKNMLAENLPLNLITKLTGITARQLKAFKH